MAKSVNLAVLSGNVGQDPKLGASSPGMERATFSLAVGEKRKDSNTNQYIENTQWYNIVAFKHTANFIAKYVTKGAKILVSGKLSNNTYTDKDGNKRTSFQIIAHEVSMLGKPKEVNGNVDVTVTAQPNGNTFIDDDIPF